MKNLLTFLIIVCISAFSASHTHAHIKANSHGVDAHKMGIEHVHEQHHHIDTETHDHNSEEFHKHLDEFYNRASRQFNDFYPDLVNLISVDISFNFAENHLRPFFESYQYALFYNSPKVFRNLPLLI
tara:strand:+ start:1736 stop:2116 length:381 start_codon:yes stop_codon:yes gene_type:complete